MNCICIFIIFSTLRPLARVRQAQAAADTCTSSLFLSSRADSTAGRLAGAHLMTVGVISAQKKMLRLLTAWEENIPMMEKATEKFLFRVPEVSDSKAEKTQGHKDNCSFSRIICTQYSTWILCEVLVHK